MNYPMWYLPEIGGGTMIALIAIIHVFVSHFAVGGGLYLVLAERKGIRANDQGILDFTRKHTKFFLLVTMVFGGLTGVAIWFIISLVQPAGTSFLIHTFVFAWATEWVFFLVEIVALFIYFYTFGRMDHRNHQIIGWIYFVAAWISLFIINGIIGFMLTPGGWLQDGDFWSGFFNPTFWPSLFFRTFVALMMAGSYAFVTTAFVKDASLKRTMTVFSGKWVLGSLLAALPSGLWYVAVLPQPAMALVKGSSPTIARALSWGTWAIVGILIVSLLLTLTKPARHNGIYATVVMVCAFLFIGSFEWTREGARRPYVINEVMYSNGIFKRDVERLNTEGFLQNAKWVRIQEFHEESLLEIGQDMFKNQCYACHTIGGFNNDIVPRTANMSFSALVSYLETIHDRRYFMPPFAGTSDEMRSLATYIYSGLQGKSMAETVAVSAAAGQISPGEQLFADNCVFCHEAALIKTKTAGWSRDRIRQGMDNLSGLNPAMPDFYGSDKEKDQLSDFILALNAPASRVVGVEHHPGESVFETHCSMCHSLRADYNPLLPKIDGWERTRLRQALDRLDSLNPAMPPLQASEEEKDALADYLMEESREVL
ncbi:c-type cytochrome [Desulfuromonas sp. KJ2020]|uniref:c-type cytochrome n=1 Tax=Desulfuromonas sp. KJ2020 TaxID=2919173 RepID=UPI0020A70DE1|nr:c-type cytochrome [Desulfuromonas sp. KJ2020]MCP3177942.1 c-type cytochrome [Desulfuromonas sp. KJ2020]